MKQLTIITEWTEGEILIKPCSASKEFFAGLKGALKERIYKTLNPSGLWQCVGFPFLLL